MARNHRLLAVLTMLGVTLWVAAPASADPLWEMKVDGNGVPLVLQAGPGHRTPDVGVLGTTDDGYVVTGDGGGSGWEFHVLDPAGEEPNNAVTGAAQAALVQTWHTSKHIYLASVASGVKDSFTGVDGLSRAIPGGSGAFLYYSGGGHASAFDVRLEDFLGNYDADGGFGATRGKSTDSTNIFQHKAGLALIGETSPGSDVLNMLAGQVASGGMGTSIGDPLNGSIMKQQWGALTGLDVGTATPGTRTITGGGNLTDGISYVSMIDNLVPGIDDTVHELAYNPLEDAVYFISQDRDNGKVYVSAITLPADAFTDEFGNDSLVTYKDLDPDDAGKKYLDITYLASSNPNDLTGQDLTESIGIGFSPEGDVMYISNEGDGDQADFDGDRVFIFKTTVPEPATLALLGLSGFGTAAAGLRRRRRR
jgi:hypothetical protein